MKKFIYILTTFTLIALYSCESLAPSDVQTNEPSLKSAVKVLNFRAHLSGENSQATGEAIFQLDTEEMLLSYKLIVADLENVTMAHIHLAPAPGQNGPPFVWLYPSAPPAVLLEGVTNGILKQGSVVISEELLQAMYEGRTYVNVHTSANPSGEIRGWIEGNMPNKKN